MWNYPNAVWQPSADNDYYSDGFKITFHSLDSLVWEVVRRLPNFDGKDVTFADVYLFFCRCQILARARTHSTPGGYGKRRNEKRKG